MGDTHAVQVESKTHSQGRPPHQLQTGTSTAASWQDVLECVPLLDLAGDHSCPGVPGSKEDVCGVGGGPLAEWGQLHQQWQRSFSGA